MWILWPFHLGRFNRVSGRAAGWVGQKGWVAFNRQSWCNNLGFMSIFLGAWTPGWCDWGGPYLWVSVDPGLRFRQTLHMGEVIDGQSLNARKRRWLYQRWEMWCFYPIPSHTPSRNHPYTIYHAKTIQKPSPIYQGVQPSSMVGRLWLVGSIPVSSRPDPCRRRPRTGQKYSKVSSFARTFQSWTSYILLMSNTSQYQPTSGEKQNTKKKHESAANVMKIIKHPPVRTAKTSRRIRGAVPSSASLVQGENQLLAIGCHPPFCFPPTWR